MLVNLELGIQDNHGKPPEKSRYLDEWQTIRSKLNGANFETSVRGLELLSIVLRIGGRFGDFGGGHGWERRRYTTNNNIVTCDMVVQFQELEENSQIFNSSRCINDFKNCIKYLLSHKAFAEQIEESSALAQEIFKELDD